MAVTFCRIRSTQHPNDLVQDIYIGQRIPFLLIFTGKCDAGPDNRPWNYSTGKGPLIMSFPTWDRSSFQVGKFALFKGNRSQVCPLGNTTIKCRKVTIMDATEIERYKLILDIVSEGIWDWDLKADRLNLNGQYCEQTGWHSTFSGQIKVTSLFRYVWTDLTK